MTLILDNNDNAPSTAVITDHTYGTDTQACGRTWLTDERTQGLDEIHVQAGAHLAVHPDLLESYVTSFIVILSVVIYLNVFHVSIMECPMVIDYCFAEQTSHC